MTWLSSRNFFQGGTKSIVMQISFVMLIFLLFSDQIWQKSSRGVPLPVEESQMANLHFKFSGLSLRSRLCVQSSTSKSRQNRFATKITGESVLNNLIDLQMFSKQVVYRRGK